MKRFLALIILSLVCIGWASQSAELAPKDAVTWIKNELVKKGFKDLRITCEGVLNSAEHNIFVEFGERGRSVEEGVDVIYEAALIVGKLQAIMRHVRGMERYPTFSVNTLRFLKNGKCCSFSRSEIRVGN